MKIGALLGAGVFVQLKMTQVLGLTIVRFWFIFPAGQRGLWPLLCWTVIRKNAFQFPANSFQADCRGAQRGRAAIVSLGPAGSSSRGAPTWPYQVCSQNCFDCKILSILSLKWPLLSWAFKDGSEAFVPFQLLADAIPAFPLIPKFVMNWSARLALHCTQGAQL